MSTAFVSTVLSKDGDEVVIEVRQVHPDYSFDEEFPLRWGAMAVAGWAFAQTYARVPRATGGGDSIVPAGTESALGRAIGGFDRLFDMGIGGLSEHVELLRFDLVRTGYNDDNRDERLREAGFSEEEVEDISLTRDVVDRICGRGRFTVRALRLEYFAPLRVGATWDF